MSRLASSVLALGLAACSSEDASIPGPSNPSTSTVQEDGGASEAAASVADASRDAAPLGPEESGEATYYNAEGKGACGIQTPPDYLVAAINDEQYSKANCGRCVSVTGPKGTVVVKVIDKCPGCDAGDLDLSETAFAKIADKSAGRIKIKWRFVECP